MLDLALGLLTQTFGLTPVFACNDYRETETFAQLWARAGSLANPKARDAWAIGSFGGARVIVAKYYTKAKLGEGESSRTGFIGWVGVLMELDHPLFMGARIAKENLFSGWFDRPDVELGVPDVDKALRLTARDPNKLRALLAPQSPQDHELLRALSRAVGDGLFVSDSYVGYRLRERNADAAKIGGALQIVRWFARELAQRAPRAPLAPDEAARAASWASHAHARGLRFDPQRLALAGEVDGVAVELRLDPSPSWTDTIVSARWPTRLPAQIYVTKSVTQTENPALSSDLAYVQMMLDYEGKDMKIGSPELDPVLQIRGYPQEEVQRILAVPALRAALVPVANASRELNLSDQQVSWTVTGLAPTAQQIDHHLDMAVRIVRALFPRPVGPAYRDGRGAG